MQENRYACLQVCRHADMQVCKYAGMQACMQGGMQECKALAVLGVCLSICRIFRLLVTHLLVPRTCLLMPPLPL